MTTEELRNEKILPVLEQPDTGTLFSFILLNFNNFHYTEACVRSLRETLNISYEIIVVDNASSDDSRKRLAGLHGVRLVLNDRNRGFTGGNNDGAAVAQGDYVVILNNDTTVYDSGLNALPDVLCRHAVNDVIGGKTIGKDGQTQCSGGYEPSFIHLLLQFCLYCYRYFPIPGVKEHWFSAFRNESAHEVDWASGTFFVMRRQTFEKLGGFDEKIFIYLDEVDLQARARKLGGRIFLYPQFRITHHQQTGWKAHNALGWKYNYQSAAYYLGKHRGALHRALFVAVTKATNALLWPLFFLANLATGRRCAKIADKLLICETFIRS